MEFNFTSLYEENSSYTDGFNSVVFIECLTKARHVVCLTFSFACLYF